MSIKKTIITTIVALALVAVVAPGVTQAATVAELLAQIQALTAQVNGLSGAGACSGVTFTRDLAVGSTGSDVKCLQTILNRSVTTQVAVTGAGSPGAETTYFGAKTLAAVQKYQAAQGLTVANVVGSLTRASLNAAIGGTVGANLPAGCTSTAGYSSTTGVSCSTSAGNLPAGCTSTFGYSSTTGASCSVSAGNLPAGCTSTAGFSTTTGASCSTGMSSGAATEGFITISSLAAAPASNANITTVSNIPVLGVNIKAVNSNETVGSVKLQLAVTKSGNAEHPATLIQKLYVYDGGTQLASFPVTTDSVIKTGSDYYMILSGLNFGIPAGQTKALTISADFNAGLETNRVLTVNLYGDDAVRGTDSLGINSTAPGSGFTSTRVYTIKYASVGASTLTVTANTGTPISTSVNVDTTNGATDVPMWVFNTKSVTGASKITDLEFTVTGTDADTLDKVDAIKLYDGSTLLGSVSLVGTTASRTATFTDLAISVAKDATKSLLVKADIASDLTSGGASSEDFVEVNLAPANVTYEEPDLSSTTASGSTVVGKRMYLFDNQAVVVTFVSGASTYTVPTVSTDGYTTGVITIKVKADGGLMTKPVAGDFTVDSYTDGISNGAVSSKNVTVTPNTDVPDGSEATVVINVSETLANTGSGFVNFKLGNDTSTGMYWELDSGATSATQFWGLEDFKTPASNAQ